MAEQLELGRDGRSPYSGTWYSYAKNSRGLNVVTELEIDEADHLTLRMQTQGKPANEPVQGPFEIQDSALTVLVNGEKLNLGKISTVNGRLVLQGDELLTFTRRDW